VNSIATLILCIALLVSPAARAQQESGVEVRSALATLRDGQWLVSGRVDYRFSRDVIEALRNGVTITFGLEIELAEERRWWPDAMVARIRQESQLAYDPLSDGYVVRNLATGEQQTFTAIYAAVRALGRISDLPLVADADLDPDRRYEVAMRAALDQEELPGPLRFLAFWSSGLDLESEWYRWPLRD
jgi:hypothetical protein